MAYSCYWISHLNLCIGSENLAVDQDNIFQLVSLFILMTADNVLAMQGENRLMTWGVDDSSMHETFSQGVIKISD